MSHELTEKELEKIKDTLIAGELPPESQARVDKHFRASEEAFSSSVEKLFKSRQFTAEDLAFRVIPQRP